MYAEILHAPLDFESPPWDTLSGGWVLGHDAWKDAVWLLYLQYEIRKQEAVLGPSCGARCRVGGCVSGWVLCLREDGGGVRWPGTRHVLPTPPFLPAPCLRSRRG